MLADQNGRPLLIARAADLPDGAPELDEATFARALGRNDGFRLRRGRLAARPRAELLADPDAARFANDPEVR